MRFIIHPGDDLPIYRQIANQVVDAIADGQLEDGERLASHRELAELLVIAPLTVKKAYDSLEAEGLIRSVQGRGTFVTASEVPRSASNTRREQLRAPARRLLAQAARANLSLTQLVVLLREEQAKLHPRSGPGSNSKKPKKRAKQ